MTPDLAIRTLIAETLGVNPETDIQILGDFYVNGGEMGDEGLRIEYEVIPWGVRTEAELKPFDLNRLLAICCRDSFVPEAPIAIGDWVKVTHDSDDTYGWIGEVVDAESGMHGTQIVAVAFGDSRYSYDDNELERVPKP